MEVRPVYVWGFTPDELRIWPPDLQPITDPPLPVTDGPVVVAAAAALQFAEMSEAHPLPDGRLMDLILYLPSGTPTPPGALYDATVQAGQWKALRRLLACPQQFRMAELADMVPLRQLTTPLDTLDLSMLDLPPTILAHLQTCAICPPVLREALRTRLRLRQQLICPSSDQLIAYARDRSDAGVARHLATCPLCAAQVQALGPVVNPLPEWGVFRSSEPTRSALAGLRTRLQQALGPVLDLFTGSIGQGWIATGAASLRRSGSQVTGPPDEAAQLALLEQVPQGETLQLLGPRKQITISWDAPQGAPRLSLEGRTRRPLAEFQVEVRQGDPVLWTASSRDGQLIIPPAAVAEAQERALAEGIVDPSAPITIVILARE